MKEKPILFNSEMIKVVLEGRKTQTRRVVKNESDKFYVESLNARICEICKHGNEFEFGKHCGICRPTKIKPTYKDYSEFELKCPYGQIGDKLWVRETFTHYRGFGEDVKPDAPIIYKADKDDCGQYPVTVDGKECLVSQKMPWKPSIFMPKKCCRIWLEIIDIRVERVQDISEIDCIAEGTRRPEDYPYICYVDEFELLWDSINAKRGYSWASNPWVWVVEFKKV